MNLCNCVIENDVGEQCQMLVIRIRVAHPKELESEGDEDK